MVGIKHKATKAVGEKGLASEWNDDHEQTGNHDVEKHQFLNNVIENRTDFPAGPVEGLIVFRTDEHTLYIYNGTSWVLHTIVAVLPPIGSVMPWLKTFTNTPALAAGWVECNGQVLSDAGSVYNGQTIPNLNGDNRFLRGNATSGGTGGASTNTSYLKVLGTDVGNFSGGEKVGWANEDANKQLMIKGSSAPSINFRWASARSDDFTNLPPYYNIVWIMRVK